MCGYDQPVGGEMANSGIIIVHLFSDLGVVKSTTCTMTTPYRRGSNVYKRLCTVKGVLTGK